LGLLTEQQLRRLQEITIFEQNLTLDAVEIFQAQSGAMREQVADIW
jgi:N-glycosylase/DNA lyase